MDIFPSISGQLFFHKTILTNAVQTAVQSWLHNVKRFEVRGFPYSLLYSKVLYFTYKEMPKSLPPNWRALGITKVKYLTLG